jgi:hypothetical protein
VLRSVLTATLLRHPLLVVVGAAESACLLALNL